METRLPITQIQPHRYRTTVHHRLAAALAFDNLHHGQSPFLQSSFVLTRKGYCAGVGLLIPSPKCCARMMLILAETAACFAKLWSAVAIERPLWEGGGMCDIAMQNHFYVL